MRRREGVEYMKTGGNVCRDSLVTHYLLWCPAVVHLLLRRGLLVIWCWEEGFLLWEWKVKGVFPSFPCFSWKEQVLPPYRGTHSHRYTPGKHAHKHTESCSDADFSGEKIHFYSLLTQQAVCFCLLWPSGGCFWSGGPRSPSVTSYIPGREKAKAIWKRLQHGGGEFRRLVPHQRRLCKLLAKPEC